MPIGPIQTAILWASPRLPTTSKDQNDVFFMQTKGTAIGTRMAPQYGNLFMADLEQTSQLNQ